MFEHVAPILSGSRSPIVICIFVSAQRLLLASDRFAACVDVDVAVELLGSEISFRVAPAHSWLSTVDVCGFVRTQCLRFSVFSRFGSIWLWTWTWTSSSSSLTSTEIQRYRYSVANMWSGNNRKSKQQKLEQAHSKNNERKRVKKEVNKNAKF